VYAQIFAANQLVFDAAILFGTTDSGKPGSTTSVRMDAANLDKLPYNADYLIPIDDVLPQICSQVVDVRENTVNHESVIGALEAIGPGECIYSGFGGQIVSERALSAGPTLIHGHSGWLPEYKGSTTSYYSVLKEGKCGVSVIELASKLDAGAILKRRHYPLPDPGVDVDYYYDSAIRADLISDFLVNGVDGGPLNQEDDSPDSMYFVIHPVLKRLALKKIGEGSS
jgi:methionyl-tRNA formyltransferase